VSRSTLEWYEQMARGLVWAAGVVLVLSVVGAIIIAGSDNALPLFEDVERQGRGVAALASLGIGLTSAGLLAGIGAILRLMVTDRLEKLGPAPETSTPAPASVAPKRGERALRRRRDEENDDEERPERK
jgi:ABC-type Fe3+ transport system permease subunit